MLIYDIGCIVREVGRLLPDLFLSDDEFLQGLLLEHSERATEDPVVDLYWLEFEKINGYALLNTLNYLVMVKNYTQKDALFAVALVYWAHNYMKSSSRRSRSSKEDVLLTTAILAYAVKQEDIFPLFRAKPVKYDKRFAKLDVIQGEPLSFKLSSTEARAIKTIRTTMGFNEVPRDIMPIIENSMIIEIHNPNIVVVRDINADDY